MCLKSILSHNWATDAASLSGLAGIQRNRHHDDLFNADRNSIARKFRNKERRRYTAILITKRRATDLARSDLRLISCCAECQSLCHAAPAPQPVSVQGLFSAKFSEKGPDIFQSLAKKSIRRLNESHPHLLV